MSLMSMTGFSRVDASHNGVTWYWEIRSVNGRGLDVRTRLGSSGDALDAKVREAVAGAIKRGSVNVALHVQRQQGAVELRLNEDALAQVVVASERVRALTGCGAPSAEGVLAIKGVLETVEVDEDAEVVAARQGVMMESLVEALGDLVRARASEGRSLAEVVSYQFDEIERLVGVVAGSPARSVDAIRARLSEQVERLVVTQQGFDEARLHQEAVLLATRSDVEEELKRLETHIKAGRNLLSGGGPVGRKLDFLAQEFNREANTLCSKSNDGDVTQAGLALKVVIDQMREQVQNIE